MPKNQNIELPLKLFIITLVAGLLLGGTYVLTKEPIAEQNRIAAEAARLEALADATFEDIDAATLEEIQNTYDNVASVFSAFRDDTLSGYVVALTQKGYGGDITLTVGVDLEGIVTGVAVGSHQETAGLGAKAAEPEFRNRFVGKSTVKVVKGAGGDGEISALTGATITSKAVAGGVNEAIEIASALSQGE